MRDVRLTVFVLAVVLALTCGAQAATFRGDLTYGGRPFADTFDPADFLSAKVFASHSATSESTVGVVDLAAGTWEITGLEPGTYLVAVVISPEEGRTSVIPKLPGELFERRTDLELADGETRELDLELLYATHLTSPLDIRDTWSGSLTSCPKGPALAEERITVAWEPIPLATSYTLYVSRYSCSELLEQEPIELDGTSVEIELDVLPEEEHLRISLGATTSEGVSVGRFPYAQYGSTASSGIYFHLSAPVVRSIHPDSSQFVVQVASIPGVGEAYWTSDLVLTSRVDEPVDVTLFYTRRGTNGADNYVDAAVVVPAGATRTIGDVVVTMFSMEGEAGSLEIRSDPPGGVGATSRISTANPGGSGTYGQGFPAVTVDDAAVMGGSAIRSGGVDTFGFRTNVALAEVWGEAATVRARLLDRDGAELGRETVDLEPFGTTQLNRISDLAGADLSEGQVEVEVIGGAGRVVGALSVVDELTDDPTTILLRPVAR